MNKKFRRLIFAVVLVALCIFLFLYLFENSFTDELKLKIATHPFPAASIHDQIGKDACTKSWEVLKEDSHIKNMISPLLDSATMITEDIDGCVLRVAASYNNSDSAQQAFQAFINLLTETNGLKVTRLDSEKSGFIFSSTAEWNMGFVTWLSYFHVIIVRHCNTITLVALIEVDDSAKFSPGVKLSQQEIMNYGRQLDQRTKYLFCPH